MFVTISLAIAFSVLFTIWFFDSFVPNVTFFFNEKKRLKEEELKRIQEEQSWAYKEINKERLNEIINYNIG